jgi:hypothetical protein
MKKTGKWVKKYVVLREGCLYYSMMGGLGALGMSMGIGTGGGSGETLICKLNGFDVYAALSSPGGDSGAVGTKVKKEKRPTGFCIALRSSQRFEIFEDKDEYVHFFCASSQEKMNDWILAIRLSKAEAMYQERPGLFERCDYVPARDKVDDGAGDGGKRGKEFKPFGAGLLLSLTSSSASSSTSSLSSLQQQKQSNAATNSNAAAAAPNTVNNTTTTATTKILTTTTGNSAGEIEVPKNSLLGRVQAQEETEAVMTASERAAVVAMGKTLLTFDEKVTGGVASSSSSSPKSKTVTIKTSNGVLGTGHGNSTSSSSSTSHARRHTPERKTMQHSSSTTTITSSPMNAAPLQRSMSRSATPTSTSRGGSAVNMERQSSLSSKPNMERSASRSGAVSPTTSPHGPTMQRSKSQRTSQQHQQHHHNRHNSGFQHGSSNNQQHHHHQNHHQVSSTSPSGSHHHHHHHRQHQRSNSYGEGPSMVSTSRSTSNRPVTFNTSPTASTATAIAAPPPPPTTTLTTSPVQMERSKSRSSSQRTKPGPLVDVSRAHYCKVCGCGEFKPGTSHGAAGVSLRETPCRNW